MRRARLVIAVASSLFGCTHALIRRNPFSERTADESRSSDTDVTLSVSRLGDGRTFPRKGLMVRLQYTGTVAATGMVIDSSRVGDCEPFQFRMGSGNVIPCYEEVLVRMSKGERATIHCPSALAYGEEGVPGTVPPNARLDFDVEILDVFEKPLSLFEKLKAEAIASMQKEARHG
eukprot:TRINITY_DN19446_c0_g1_i1.p1 TRINITY_DN19446_c0_g1~~TRINITY_DN19446_c0_g1_i1.p1  ORF type:complete len:175 (-),score=22.22 TRINITY_DN19446_c0_g1_i1:4-528(-)